jgi:hypothetical protein
MVILSAEIRSFLSDNDYFYPFAEVAYFENYIKDNIGHTLKKDNTKYGFGFGLNISSRQRQVKFEFSWGENPTLTEPRLNITIGDRF